MTVCPHCKSTNNNFYYCKGCGRKIPENSKPAARKESASPRFIEEVIDIIERNLDYTDITISAPASNFGINLSEISKDEGILIIGGEQWQETDPAQQCSCFFGEIICTYLISAIITMVGFIAGADGIEMIFQLYASAFLVLSLITWFIVPYFTGFSPVSSLLYNCSMFTLENESAKNKAKNLFMMFLFSSIPSLFVLPFFYSLLKSRFSENYLPPAFSSSEIRYLEKAEN
ncbi:hypothetical protein IKP13_03505 [bacterium]|nr:hypothetical protein [bacterium]